MKKIPLKKIRRNVTIFLDFDGTLSPIVSHPRGAKLPLATKRHLIALRRNGIKIAIVTGRILKDIKKRVGIRDIIYAANHGLEIYYKGSFLLKKGARVKAPIGRLSSAISKAMAEFKGVVIEDKQLSVAVHYRLVPKRHHSRLSKIVKNLAAPYLKKYPLHLTGGKMVWEIKPAKLWNKGKAVLWIWRRMAKKSVPIYIGDDLTDEAAFKALRKKGITIRVGYMKGSAAEYFLDSPREVARLLKVLTVLSST